MLGDATETPRNVLSSLAARTISEVSYSAAYGAAAVGRDGSESRYACQPCAYVAETAAKPCTSVARAASRAADVECARPRARVVWVLRTPSTSPSGVVATS